jgi:hypothetical protein
MSSIPSAHRSGPTVSRIHSSIDVWRPSTSTHQSDTTAITPDCGVGVSSFPVPLTWRRIACLWISATCLLMTCLSFVGVGVRVTRIS